MTFRVGRHNRNRTMRGSFNSFIPNRVGKAEKSAEQNNKTLKTENNNKKCKNSTNKIPPQFSEIL